MKNNLLILTGAVLILLLLWAGSFLYKNFRGAGVLISPPVGDVSMLVTSTSSPFSLPDGFSISIFAKDLSGARVMARDQFGNFWVSQPSLGQVSLLEVQDGEIKNQYAVFKNLRKPHGLAFDPSRPSALYIAEEDKISRVAVYSDGPIEKIADLPAGGNHTTRTIGFGPDGKLYVSIGSSCNVCNEKGERRAKIFYMKSDGSDLKEFARGLRNTVFFVWDETGRMWGTDMGLDYLGDNLPPDELNIISEGANYGWPTCYGKNVHDTDFDKNTYIRAPCQEPFEIPSTVDIPAHSAPLGLAFVPRVTTGEGGWPKEMQGDLLVAYHGSWNRSTPTGYKIVRMIFDEKGNYSETRDFITGWLGDKGVLGRPVGLIFDTSESLYITDDKSGVIYKVEYQGG